MFFIEEWWESLSVVILLSAIPFLILYRAVKQAKNGLSAGSISFPNLTICILFTALIMPALFFVNGWIEQAMLGRVQSLIFPIVLMFGPGFWIIYLPRRFIEKSYRLEVNGRELMFVICARFALFVWVILHFFGGVGIYRAMGIDADF